MLGRFAIILTAAVMALGTLASYRLAVAADSGATACPLSAVTATFGDTRAARDGTTCPSTIGEQRVLVLLVNFLDGPSEPFTREEISEIVFDASNPSSVHAYIEEVSYGQASLAGDVVDWITVPVNAEDCADFFEVSTLGTLLDAIDPPIDVTTYGRFMIVHALPSGTAPCTPGSTSTIGAVSVSTSQGAVCGSVLRVGVSNDSLLATTHARALIHELGHSLGVGHAEDIECGNASVGKVPQQCTLSNPGRDRYDIMGQVGLRGHYNAIFKEEFGWLDANHIEVVHVLPATVALDPIELPTGGTHVLMVPASYELGPLRSSTHYVVTYRQAIGADAIYTELQGPATGVMIRLRSTGPGLAVESALVDTTPHKTSAALPQLDDSAEVVLSIGERYVDGQRGVSITFTDVAGGAAIVTVDAYNGGPLSPTSGLVAKCKRVKLGATASKVRDLLRIIGQDQIRPDAEKLAGRVSKAQSKFTKAFTSAERNGCRTIGDVSAIEGKVDAFVADVTQAAP
jgi:M6 family metalloprotease-like protein